jgi:hypothetical protein
MAALPCGWVEGVVRHGGAEWVLIHEKSPFKKASTIGPPSTTKKQIIPKYLS